MRRLFVTLAMATALSFALCAMAFAGEASILADLNKSDVAVEHLDDQAMDQIRGTGVNQSGTTTYYVKKNAYGSMFDYRSYTITSMGRSPSGVYELKDGVMRYRHEENYATGYNSYIERQTVWSNQEYNAFVGKYKPTRVSSTWNRPESVVTWGGW